MELFFSPLACSMATRIALYEAGADARYVEVDSDAKRTLPAGDDYRAVHPLGLVPAVRMDDGDVLTENAAVLQYVASRFPAARLAPDDAAGRARLQQWLCFIGTELHRPLAMLLDKKAHAAVHAYALAKVGPRLDYVAAHLEGREHLLDGFTVADAYLTTVLNWTVVLPVDLKKWPAIAAYQARMHERPSVRRAFLEERPLYAAELERARAREAKAAQTAGA